MACAIQRPQIFPFLSSFPFISLSPLHTTCPQPPSLSHSANFPLWVHASCWVATRRRCRWWGGCRERGYWVNRVRETHSLESVTRKVPAVITILGISIHPLLTRNWICCCDVLYAMMTADENLDSRGDNSQSWETDKLHKTQIELCWLRVFIDLW